MVRSISFHLDMLLTPAGFLWSAEGRDRLILELPYLP